MTDKVPATDDVAPGGVFPFLTGCQRSGTTLLRVILDAHSDLSVPSESQFWNTFARRRDRYEADGRLLVEPFIDDLKDEPRFRRWHIPREALAEAMADPVPASFQAGVRRVYGLFAARAGKTRYADKTPRYAPDILLFAALFADARFVHVMRDGRDVALSLLDMPWGPSRFPMAALFWRDKVLAAREAGTILGPTRYHEYRHEDLLDDPETHVRALCDFIDLPFEPQMLDYHESRKPAKNEHMQHLTKPPTKGLRDWRRTMPSRDVRLFEILAGDVLESLGYETVTTPKTVRALEPILQAEARAARLRQAWRRYTSGPAT